MYVTISGLFKLTVTADKRATVQSTVVTKTLISCSTIHELSVLHPWECDAMTRKAVNRLANKNRINCLFGIIGQTDTSIFFAEQRNTCAKGTEDGQERKRQDAVQFRP